MKIDVTKIQGYESLSAEDKIKALEDFDLSVDYTGYVKKDVFDKTSSELADLKKKQKEQLSAEEKAKLENEEMLGNLKSELESLRKEKSISENKANFLALGYSEELATSTAKAMTEGDMATVLKNQKAHQDSLSEQIKADILKETPNPNKIGNGGTTMTLEKLRKMSAEERYAYAEEHPDEYVNLYQNK